MQTWTIREAIQSDIQHLGKLNQQLIKDEGHSNPMDVISLTSRMANWLRLGDYRCFVITDPVIDIAGYALFKIIPSGYYLRQLFVCHAYRRQGLASQLLDYLFANVWQGKEVRLDVLATNHRAIAFYQAYGLTLYCHTFRRESQS